MRGVAPVERRRSCAACIYHYLIDMIQFNLALASGVVKGGSVDPMRMCVLKYSQEGQGFVHDEVESRERLATEFKELDA